MSKDLLALIEKAVICDRPSKGNLLSEPKVERKIGSRIEFKRVPDRDKEDVLQEIKKRIYQRIPTFRNVNSLPAFFAWLDQISKGVIADFLKNTIRYNQILLIMEEIPDQEDHSDLPDIKLQKKEYLNLIQQGMLLLDSEAFLLFKHRHEDNKSLRDLEKEHGIPRETIRRILKDAEEIIRNYIKRKIKGIQE